jgi:hypothetical protein
MGGCFELIRDMGPPPLYWISSRAIAVRLGRLEKLRAMAIRSKER